MNVLNGRGAMPRRPVGLVVASDFHMASHRRSLVLRGLKAEMRAPEAALADPRALPPCALLLIETTGLADPIAASLVAFAAERRRRGTAVVVVCPAAHLDFLAGLLGTGATLLCEPGQKDVDRALQDAAGMIWRRRINEGRSARIPGFIPAPSPPCPWPQAESSAGPERPYWLDILSDALTDRAIAQQADEPGSAVTAELLEQMIVRLLAVPSDQALLHVAQTAMLGEGSAELAWLVVELERRGLALACRFNGAGAAG